MSGSGEPLLVVGAGPVGLVAALALSRAGVPVRLIDKAGSASTLSKATTVQARSLELFADLGVADEVLDRSARGHAVNVWSRGHRIARFGYDDLDSPYPFMAHLPQSDVEQVLSAAVEAAGVKIERGLTLTGLEQDDGGVRALVGLPGGTAEELHAPYVVACDGAHSTARHLLGLEFAGHAFEGEFALGDVRLDWDLPHDELHVFVAAEGGLFVIPLPGGRARIVAQSSENRGTVAPTLTELQAYVSARGRAGAGIEDPSWLATFRVNSRQAAHHRVGRVLLAGDAVHIHSPVGGQGMNTGMQDAYNLAWKLALVHAGRARAQLLDSYEAERAPVAAGVLRDTERLTKVLTTESPTAAALRDHLAPLVTGRHAVSHQVAEQDSQLVVSYAGTALVSSVGHHHHGTPRAGDRAPDVAGLVAPDGATTSFHALLAGPEHVVVLRGPEPEVRTVTDRLLARYGTDVRVLPVGLPGGITDPSGGLDAAYGLGTEGALVVRPDGYLGHRSSGLHPDRLLEALDRVLLPQPAPA